MPVARTLRVLPIPLGAKEWLGLLAASWGSLANPKCAGRRWAGLGFLQVLAAQQRRRHSCQRLKARRRWQWSPPWVFAEGKASFAVWLDFEGVLAKRQRSTPEFAAALIFVILVEVAKCWPQVT
jgi:hypothetical protein